MHILPILFFGLAANLDNLGIGISYGVRKVRIPFLSNFFIALLSGIVAALSVLTGALLSRVVDWANVAGSVLLIAIGIWVAWPKHSQELALPVSAPVSKTYSVPVKPLGLFIEITKDPSLADLDANGFISAKEAIVLGLTLSINCIATGVSAGLTGLAPLPMALSVFLFSMAAISAGYITGWRTAAQRFERAAQYLSGAMLIFIGIWEYLH